MDGVLLFQCRAHSTALLNGDGRTLMSWSNELIVSEGGRRDGYK